MKEITVMYEGREVPSRGFRVYVYGRNGESKLVESWQEYRLAIETGYWFSKQSDCKTIKRQKKLDDAPKKTDE